jgi:hypothetical protein
MQGKTFMSNDRSALSSREMKVALKAAMATLLALSCVAGIPRPVHADQGGGRGREFREHEFREREFHRDQFRDSRYHHDRYYPPRGYQFSALPPHPRLIVHGGRRYYFSGGVWYQPSRNVYVVVRPPIGIIVPFLPPYYTRVWVGPYPYYYANDVYYVSTPQGYTVVEQPPGTIAMTPPAGMVVPPDNGVTELGPVNNGVQQMAPWPPVSATNRAPVGTPPAVAQAGGNQLFIYPRQGQSADQQNRDRGECNSWAIGQTGRDPASSGGPMDPAYQRAFGACLDGRGYTVK